VPGLIITVTAIGVWAASRLRAAEWVFDAVGFGRLDLTLAKEHLNGWLLFQDAMGPVRERIRAWTAFHELAAGPVVEAVEPGRVWTEADLAAAEEYLLVHGPPVAPAELVAQALTAHARVNEGLFESEEDLTRVEAAMSAAHVRPTRCQRRTVARQRARERFRRNHRCSEEAEDWGHCSACGNSFGLAWPEVCPDTWSLDEMPPVIVVDEGISAASFAQRGKERRSAADKAYKVRKALTTPPEPKTPKRRKPTKARTAATNRGVREPEAYHRAEEVCGGDVAADENVQPQQPPKNSYRGARKPTKARTKAANDRVRLEEATEANCIEDVTVHKPSLPAAAKPPMRSSAWFVPQKAHAVPFIVAPAEESPVQLVVQLVHYHFYGEPDFAHESRERALTWAREASGRKHLLLQPIWVGGETWVNLAGFEAYHDNFLDVIEEAVWWYDQGNMVWDWDMASTLPAQMRGRGYIPESLYRAISRNIRRTIRANLSLVLKYRDYYDSVAWEADRRQAAADQEAAVEAYWDEAEDVCQMAVKRRDTSVKPTKGKVSQVQRGLLPKHAKRTKLRTRAANHAARGGW
jgi:hypothetical protein